MGIKSFINELKDPSLKCERVGHDLREYKRRGYYHGGFMAVVTEVFQTSKRCKRCNYQEEWKTVRESGIQSFTGPTQMVEEIHSHSSENPYWVAHWWA